MTRRAALLAMAGPLVAATPTEAVETVAKLAAALSDGDAPEFMRHIDAAFPDREKLRGWITALTGEAFLTSSVELVENSGDEAKADWYLQIKSRAPAGPLERRRKVVAVRFSGTKVIAFDPVDFFAPMGTGAQ